MAGCDVCELLLGADDVFDEAQRVGVQGLVGGPLAGFADLNVLEVSFDLTAGSPSLVEVGVQVSFFAQVLQRVQFAELAGGAGDRVEHVRVGLQELLLVAVGVLVGTKVSDRVIGGSWSTTWARASMV